MAIVEMSMSKLADWSLLFACRKGLKNKENMRLDPSYLEEARR
jgi:hypothetical protein